jgi:hypothetical protein
MGDPTKLRLAPAEVFFDGVSLGYLSFETDLEIEDETRGVPLRAAQEGDTPVDIVLTGHSCIVRSAVVEVTPEKLALAVPNAELTGGTVPSADPDDIFTFPFATPAPGTVTRRMNANRQEEFAIAFQIWPDPTTKAFYTNG